MEKPRPTGSTTNARAIWEQVNRVAQQTPEWMKERVTQASKDTVQRITGKTGESGSTK